jgi:hypothetical protein
MITRMLPVVGATTLLLIAGCGGSSSSSSASGSAGAAPSSPASESAGAASSSSSSPSSASGLQGLSAGQVLAKAKAAFTGASSVHVVLRAAEQGHRVSYDVRYVRSKGATGTVNAGTGNMKLIAIGNDIYFSGDAQVLAQFGGSAAAGTWFKTSRTSAVGAALSELTDVNKIAAQIFKPSGTIAVVQGKDVDGTGTVGILDKGPDGGTLYVASEGEPYPLLIEPPAKQKDKGEGRFTEYNAPVKLTPPAKFLTLPG